MQEYKRLYPLFSLCGLNCALCPRYHTDGSSKCPGCGGPEFHLKHPACAVITCNKKHDSVEYCFECSAFPCEKYREPSVNDSFVAYKNVLTDFGKAKDGLANYKKALEEKIKILELLLERYNDGRKKNFYCVAVNLLSLEGLKRVMARVRVEVDPQALDCKAGAKLVTALLEEAAEKERIVIELRK